MSEASRDFSSAKLAPIDSWQASGLLLRTLTVMVIAKRTLYYSATLPSMSLRQNLHRSLLGTCSWISCTDRW